ncbi:LCP family protein [Bacillus alkalicellulosilyticus]|uniref:LCP family glycopolymer transferase n=1 Tax=Alkalihalobacterium alkalicellulosilyticum TaxID=1912214 RepID=UPI0009989A96|nr:LCP family protein [Bacillus alkalicellulosilyticus]
MKKPLLIVGMIMSVLALAVGGYGFYLYNSVSVMHDPLDREKSDKREEKVSVNSKEPISILLAGVDSTGEEHEGRSDTLIVLTVNPNTQSAKMVSIPRDTRTEIIGRGQLDKINHAYAFGGVQMTIDTVENLLDIPIDHYVSINMEGFTKIVDSLGGVTVENDFAFTEGKHYFEEGQLHLSGEEALSYARMRKKDPRGDFGRNARQRQVVEAVIQEGAQFSSITRVGDILGIVGQSVRTDLLLDDMWTIQSKYSPARHHIEQIELTGEGTNINGIYYLNIPEEEIQRVRHELRAHLEIDKVFAGGNSSIQQP